MPKGPGFKSLKLEPYVLGNEAFDRWLRTCSIPTKNLRLEIPW